MLCDFETKSPQFCGLLLTLYATPEDISVFDPHIWTICVRFEAEFRRDNEMQCPDGENKPCKSERMVSLRPRDFQLQVKEIGKVVVDILGNAEHGLHGVEVFKPGNTERDQTEELRVA